MRKTRTTSVSRSHAGGLCEAGPDAVRDLPPPDRINMPSEVPGEGFCPALWILVTLGNHKKSKSYRGHWYKTCTISPLYSAKNPSLLPCAPDAIAARAAIHAGHRGLRLALAGSIRSVPGRHPSLERVADLPRDERGRGSQSGGRAHAIRTRRARRQGSVNRRHQRLIQLGRQLDRPRRGDVVDADEGDRTQASITMPCARQ
jgi:hypothetical protein